MEISAADPNDALKQGGRTDTITDGGRTRGVLVVVEVALSLVLLVAAGLMIRTLWNLRHVDPGFDPQHVLAMTVGVSTTDYDSPAKEVAFFDEVLRHVRVLPGVEAAGVADDLPLEGGSNQPVAIEGHPVVAMADQPEVSVRNVSPGYFSAMRIGLLRGRGFTDADRADAAAVVIISESMAKRFWPNQDAIGKRLTLTFFPARVREVVGIVRDVKDNGLATNEASPMLYWPIAQFYQPERFGKFQSFPMRLVVRTAMDSAAAAGDIKNVLRQVSANTPLTSIQTMQDLVTESISPQRFNMLLLAAFGGLALLLAAVGIYSVLAYAVRRRLHEIGIRMALGASVSDVLRMVLVEGLRPTLLGVAIGALAAVALSRVLGSLIYGVRATDVPTFLCVCTLLIAVGVIASALPAYRASRVDPLNTLRDE